MHVDRVSTTPFTFSSKSGSRFLLPLPKDLMTWFKSPCVSVADLLQKYMLDFIVEGHGEVSTTPLYFRGRGMYVD